ncbi:MAG: rRNA maturation RNase YbeY [Rhizobiaceae bacterium]|nr:rRNA maturation RNase YbeY [Rhizobiaceae bacterium]
MPNKSTEISIDIAVNSDRWENIEAFDELAQTTSNVVVQWLIAHEEARFPQLPMELSVLLTDDASIKEINAKWREQNKATNVLSFPTKELKVGDMPMPLLGDIIFAYETIFRESEELTKSFEEHLTHLFIHGFLHLLGYDHINDTDAEQMERIETGILTSIGLSDPYEN